MKLSPLHSLTEEEHGLLIRYLEGHSRTEAVTLVLGLEGKECDLKAAAVFRKGRPVARALEWCRTATVADLARDSLLQGLLASRDGKQRGSTAKLLLEQDAKGSAADATRAWAALLDTAGATVVIPARYQAREHEVPFGELLRSGEGFVRLPFPAMLRILKQAGAPWNEHDPHAELSPFQREVLSYSEQTVVVHGGTGLGKSATAAGLIVCGLQIPGYRIAIVGDTYDHCWNEFEYVERGMRQLHDAAAFKRFVANNRLQHHEMVIQPIWGSFCTALSMQRDEGDQALGKEFDLVVLAEGSKVAADTYRRKIRRAVGRRYKEIALCAPKCPGRRGHKTCSKEEHRYARRTGRLFSMTTPDGFAGASSAIWDDAERRSRGRLERLHDGGSVPWRQTVRLREAANAENPSFSQAEIDAAERLLPPEVFAEQYLGKRTRKSGLVWPEYREPSHLRPDPTPAALRAMRFGVCIDTGYYFSAGLGGLAADRTKWRLGESCATGVEVGRACEDLQSMLVDRLGPVFGASEWEAVRDQIDWWLVDPASQHKLEIEERLGVSLDWVKLDLGGSIDEIRRFLRTGQLLFAEGGLIDPLSAEGRGIRHEITRYVWPRKVQLGDNREDPKKPAVGNDHSCDELRMLTCHMDEQYEGIVWETRPSLDFEEQWRQTVLLPGIVAGLRAQMDGAPAEGLPFHEVHR